MVSSPKGFDVEANIKITALLAKSLLNNISNIEGGWGGEEEERDEEEGVKEVGEVWDEKFAEEDEENKNVLVLQIENWLTGLELKNF